MFVFKSYQDAATSTHARNQVAGFFGRWARHAWPLWLALGLFLLSPATRGQLYTGSVTGVVTDPSGGSVPGAKVALLDEEKGYAFNAVTDSNGRYLLRSIPPGTYKIKVEAANFQSQTQDAVKVDVSQNVSIDFSMKVGVVTDIVEVKADTVQLQTEDAVTGQVVNRKFVNDLPLVDRNFTNLAFLAPGVTETNAPGTKNSQGGINFNSNGSRNATADVLIDGATASNFDQNSGLNNVLYTPSVDSVEEFKVQQANFTAEYGFSAGALINVVTRSGTNQFHGSVYEFFRNSVMDANDWFNNKNGNPIPALKRNDFGGSVGGPIRKDKTFFFFDYEGIRERDATNATAGVPTAAERNGDFGVLCGANGGTFDATGLCSSPAGQLWDPYTGTFNPDPAGDGSIGPGAVRTNFIPFNNFAAYQSPGNPNLVGTPFQPAAHPGNLIDPVAAKLIQLFPMPTVSATDLSTLQNSNWFGSGVNPTSNNQFDIKIDHRFSERDLLSAKYSQQNGSSNSFDCFKNIADPCTGGPVILHRHIFSLSHTHTFSPSLVLTATYGFQRGFDNQQGISGNDSGAQQGLASLGFPSYLNHGFGTIPAIQINGYSGAAGNNIGTQTFSILREGQVVHHVDSTLSWVRGKHELKFGGEWRLHQINFTQPGWPSGDFAFDFSGNSQVSSDPNSGGDGLASFLMGIGPPGNGGGGCTPCQVGFVNFVSTESFQYGAFAQDNYRITPKLTLNLGLRYELGTPRTERFNRMNSLDPTAASPLQLTPAQITLAQSQGLPASAIQTLSSLHGIEVFAGTNGRSNYDTDFKNIQPRFGLAYQAPHGFVIRGGYGIYFSTPRSGASGTGPWGFQGFDVQPPWLTTLNVDHATPWNTLSNTSCQFAAPFTCGVAPPPGNSLGAFNDIGFAAVGPIKRQSLNTPYEEAWSFGFQKELPGKILFDASYVGKKGTHLYLGGFRENNHLPLSAVTDSSGNLLPASQLANLNNFVSNPFFDPNPGPCDRTHFICDPTSALSQATVQEFQLLLPFPQYAGFQGDSPPIANSIYHALQIRAEHEFSNGLQFLVTYTWSKSIDNASASDDSFVFLGGGTTGGSTLSVQNPFDLRAERAVSVFDIPHIFQASFVYELPVGRGQKFGNQLHPVLNAIVGGWHVNGIVRVNSGRPIIPLLLNTNPIPTFGQRPILTGTLKPASGSPENFTSSGTSYFANAGVDAAGNPTGVLEDTSVQAPFTFGNAPRTITSVRQPGVRNADLSLFKEFALSRLREGARLEFRAESFNTFNHPQFQGPDSVVGDSNFGIISSQLNHPRELQLALKLYF